MLLTQLSTFIFEPRGIALLLTLTGGIFFCGGMKSDRFAVPFLGVLLQCAALYLFLNTVWYPFRASLFINSYFVGTTAIAVTAFVSLFFLQFYHIGSSTLNKLYFFIFSFMGLLSWYLGGIREIYMHIIIPEQSSGVLLLLSATSILVGLVAEKTQWRNLNYILLLQLPAMLAILRSQLLSGPVDYSLLVGWGATVWPVTFFVQYRILSVLDELRWSGIGVYYHFVSVWALLFVSSRELLIEVIQRGYTSIFSMLVLTIICVIVWCTVVLFMARRKYWPVSVFPSMYFWGGSIGLVLFFFGWLRKLSII